MWRKLPNFIKIKQTFVYWMCFVLIESNFVIHPFPSKSLKPHKYQTIRADIFPNCSAPVMCHMTGGEQQKVKAHLKNSLKWIKHQIKKEIN